MLKFNKVKNHADSVGSEYELKKIDFNFHQSLMNQGRMMFDEIFTREYFRIIYWRLYIKKERSEEEDAKIEILERTFEYSKESASTSFEYSKEVPEEIRTLLILTLWAHVGILKNIERDEETGDLKLNYEKLTLRMNEFYLLCKNTVPGIVNKTIKFDDAINRIKDDYRNSCHLIDCEAVDGFRKKWVESEKKKNVEAFIGGLLPKYKVTASNRIRKDTPLKSQETFEKYVSMWIVTCGHLEFNKTSQKSAETFESLVKRYGSTSVKGGLKPDNK